MKIKLIILMLSFILCASISGIQAEAKTNEYKNIIGRWVRPDGGYILAVKSVDEDGKIDAEYFNPRPIHVSKAKASIKDGEINIFVELRDAGYPGSYYTLKYEPGPDQLVGVYYHKVLNKDFDIFFVRE